MSSGQRVHLVVPCFQESRRIAAFLPELCRVMTELGHISILVIDDGSGKEEAERMTNLIEELRSRFACLLPLKTLSENIGKGGAVYAGWDEAADAEWVAFVDADGACSAQEVRRIIIEAKSSEQENQALFATRVKMLGRRVNRLIKRHLLGRIYASLVSVLLKIPAYDTQCGLKIVKRKAYEAISQGLCIHGFAFDVELLAALLDSGAKVSEFPIDWQEVPGGKVKLLRDAWRMAKDVMIIQTNRSRCQP